MVGVATIMTAAVKTAAMFIIMMIASLVAGLIIYSLLQFLFDYANFVTYG